MAGNIALRKADRIKNDEFYTQLEDIEKELRHYRKHFKNKIVFCNCDDPYESNFFKYFAMNFNFLGLKKLIATSYQGSLVAGKEFKNPNIVCNNEKYAYKIEISEVTDVNRDGAIDLFDVEYLLKNDKNSLIRLKGDGDFRSQECLEILSDADIVVTNPPFSMFREYVTQLVEYDKKFLIIGNKNAITYKEFFPLLKENKVWIGYNSVKEFRKPDGTTQKFGNVGWYTNLDIPKRYEEIEMWKKFITEEYPKFDNYDAINVDKTTDIPEDYYDKMGVPISFMDKHNPEQFEIIDGIGRYSILDNENTKKAGKYLSMINGEAKYFRIIIRRKQNGN